ncbi:copper homeostasis periplasmic binding protein CopC [Novosphingobium sp.]|uniref:copper homeostasis periplasmic binding protein CopC n=1 Tax=Novosphingobium sp. TaxID=1874826 RepID=UPI00333FA0F1
MKHSHAIRALLAVFALGVGATAEAHPKLLRANPAANATVAGPTRVMLAFSERLIAPMSGGDIIATALASRGTTAAIKVAGVTSAVIGGKSLMLTLKRPLAPGSYRLNWHVVSVDTHRVQGTFSFKVK